MSSPSDEELLGQYIAGSVSAFESLYRRHKASLYRFILRQIDVNSAEEIYQETWASVISHAQELSTKEHFKAWLFAVARRKIIDRYRHLSVVSSVIDIDESIDDHTTTRPFDSESELGRAKMAQDLLICLNKLPVAQREVFILKEESGFKYKEMATVLNIGVEGVKSRISAMYDNLRKCLAVAWTDLGDK